MRGKAEIHSAWQKQHSKHGRRHTQRVLILPSFFVTFQSRFVTADLNSGNAVAACNLDKRNLISSKPPPPPVD